MVTDLTAIRLTASPAPPQDNGWVVDWSGVPAVARPDEDDGSGGGGGFGPEHFDTGLCVTVWLPGSSVHGLPGFIMARLENNRWQIALEIGQWCTLATPQIRPVIVEPTGPYLVQR